MPEIKVIVRIVGPDVSDSLFEDAFEKCQNAGLRVDRTMPILGLISGWINKDRVSELSSISNVEVELDVGKNTSDESPY